VRAAWCFGPEGELPIGDVMLAQKIALEKNERAALALANRGSRYDAGKIWIGRLRQRVPGPPPHGRLRYDAIGWASNKERPRLSNGARLVSDLFPHQRQGAVLS
jgi:hypothetical protein